MVTLSLGACSQPNNMDVSGSNNVVKVVTDKKCPIVVHGEIWYKAKIALSSSDVEVRLEDVSIADASAITIGKSSFPTNGMQVPLKFSLEADCDRLNNAVVTGFSVRITQAGELIYTNDTHFPYEKESLNRIEVVPVNY